MLFVGSDGSRPRITCLPIYLGTYLPTRRRYQAYYAVGTSSSIAGNSDEKETHVGERLAALVSSHAPSIPLHPRVDPSDESKQNKRQEEEYLPTCLPPLPAQQEMVKWGSGP